MTTERISFGITLAPKLYERIEQDRGMVPRTKYLERLIERGMKSEQYFATRR